MGLFSDLFKKVKQGIDEIEDAIGNDTPNTASSASYTAPAEEVPAAPSCSAEGGSYYDRMPAEECQYNFNGTYVEYFAKIFREDFPEYEASYERASNRDAVIFTLKKNGATSLVCELLSENSVAKKVRADCKAAGIPYVRFYFNHEGWWNARSYVVDRIKSVL